jgi:hypothetical protein
METIIPLNPSKFKSLKSNFLEYAVLKTYFLGYSDVETQEFLEIDKTVYYSMIENIFLTYKTENLFEIIYTSLSDGKIDRYDIVKDEVKKVAIRYSNSIYDTINSMNLLSIKKNIVIKQLNNFMIDVNKLFINKAFHDELNPLTTEEINYCKKHLNKFASNDSYYSSVNFETSKIIEKKLITKFKTNNYFNAIRRVLELNLIDKCDLNNYFNSYNDDLKVSIAQKMESVFILDKYSDKEKQLCIYFDLISYYNKLEDILLFKING